MQAANLTTIAPKISSLIPLLGSDQDGEVVATARAIKRVLATANLDLYDLAKVLQVPPTAPPPQRPDWRRMATWLRDNDHGHLSDGERKFVWDMTLRRSEPTGRQYDWLLAIFRRRTA
jgi:hypothetical protein